MNRKKAERALAEFDEINALWVRPMVIPKEQKDLRVEMMGEFERLIKELKKPPERDRFSDSEWVMLNAVYAMSYKEIYIEIVNKYYLRYVRLIKRGGTVSAFAKAWLDVHAKAFGLYKHTQDPRTAARTEVGAMGSLAELDGLYQAGYRHKKWETVLDGKERPDHREAAGQIRKLEEPFIIGGYEMMFPQDSSMGAPPEQIVNCRCSMSGVR
ncbi:MAG: hypothetical protein IJ740_06045 [Ruminococcus sp.]|nr:hypothetical protein [Ruminococcus sp.]